MAAMSRRCPVFFAWLLVAAAAHAQLPLSPIDIANLQEDVRGLTQRLNELSLQVEQLQHQTAAAPSPFPANGSYATVVQLNQAVADLNRAIQVAVATSQTDIIAQVNVQLKKMTQQVNAALAAGGRKPMAATPAETAPTAEATDGTFSTDYPKTGESYTVQKGDSLASIAKKLGAKRQDIINANQIADPGRIQAGKVLFIPEAK
jgi:LysM repeat protein